MGDYTWMTYSQIDEMAHNFGCGLRALGHQPKQNLVVFAETRAEWLISAMGLFKQNIPLCTLYATLGDEAIVHGINETEVRQCFFLFGTKLAHAKQSDVTMIGGLRA